MQDTKKSFPQDDTDFNLPNFNTLMTILILIVQGN